jgi:phosphatidylglycerol:prolipoprotein diacylglycerol transferase
VVGGRLGYVLLYQPSLLWRFEGSFPWWGVIDLAHGGMASHGGMVGLVLVCVYWAAKLRKAGIAGASALHLMDCVVLTAPPGIFLGRIANFINGELLGRIAAMPGEPAPWWAVRFPQELTEPKLAPALNAGQERALWDLIARHTNPGESTGDALARIIGAIQSGAMTLKAELTPLLSARHPSQLYQAFAEGVVLMAVLWLVWRPSRRHGVALAWFLMVYGVGRIVTEFWRLPDAHLAVQRFAGLSRGQWLSVAMVVIGAVVLSMVRGRRPQTQGLRPEAK